jgi:hypothetical protein
MSTLGEFLGELVAALARGIEAWMRDPIGVLRGVWTELRYVVSGGVRR